MDRAESYRATLRYFLDPVADYLYEDGSVTEVQINGHDEVYIERAGRLHKTDRRFASPAALLRAVTNLAEYVGRRLDARHLSMSARLPEPEQFRVHVIIPPASRQGINVSIRKFHQAETTLAWMVEQGTLSPAAAEYLAVVVHAHRNLIVSGRTGTGKTTLLNALSGAIPAHERIIVIEDPTELKLQQPHTRYLEAKAPGPDGLGGATIRDLFLNSLRMRPDRIIVGECRAGEAVDLVQSMLSGHDGSLSTVHAGRPRDALARLETMCLRSDAGMPVRVARVQVAAAVHVIAQIARLSDGTRRVVTIAEAAGLDRDEQYRLRPVFEFRTTGRDANDFVTGQLEPTGQRSLFTRDILASEAARDIRLTRPLFTLGDTEDDDEPLDRPAQV